MHEVDPDQRRVQGHHVQRHAVAGVVQADAGVLDDKHRGARVFGTVSTEDKAKLAK